MEKAAPSSGSIPALIPASMLAAFAYCPRLCYIQWVEGEFQDSAETVDGRLAHRWIDAEEDPVPEDFQPFHARSVYLTAPQAGICCRLDLLEGEGRKATPVEYKRGRAPQTPEGLYEPYQIQLCAQALALRENGFSCDQGMVYFMGSKERVPVKIDQFLIDRTLALVAAIRSVTENGRMPPPLQRSSRCNRCSLAGVCLPDEVNLLREMEAEEIDEGGQDKQIRKLLPARDDAVPIYVVGQRHTVRKRGERLEVWSHDEGKVSEARIMEVSQVNLYGGVEITTPATVELMQRGIPVLHFTHGGWFQGICQGMSHKNVELRIRQFEWSRDPEKSLKIARSLVFGKIKNCRTLVKRNNPESSEGALEKLTSLSMEAKNASSMQSLLGFEGSAAEVYFGLFAGMLKSGASEFSFQNRNKRPPQDPANTVLSYLYGILAKECFVTLLAVGFDPYLGFYHQPRYGRPALALDLMEEFRPLIADSIAVTLFNNRELDQADFVRTGIGISLGSDAKRKVLAGYEQRIQLEISHPLFGYKVSYRRVLEIQARLLARVLAGELVDYPAFVTR